MELNWHDFISWYIRRHLGPEAQWFWLMTNGRAKVEPLENEQEYAQSLVDWFMSLDLEDMSDE